MAFSKLALIRDQSVPVGQPAPMHLECKCGNKVDVDGDRNGCACGAVYDARGYVIVASVTTVTSHTEVSARYQ